MAAILKNLHQKKETHDFYSYKILTELSTIVVILKNLNIVTKYYLIGPIMYDLAPKVTNIVTFRAKKNFP